MTKYHFADRWQRRPLVWTDDQKQLQYLDGKNVNVVLRHPFSPNLVPRDYVSVDEIATARAQFTGRPRNSGRILAVFPAMTQTSHAMHPFRRGLT